MTPDLALHHKAMQSGNEAFLKALRTGRSLSSDLVWSNNRPIGNPTYPDLAARPEGIFVDSSICPRCGTRAAVGCKHTRRA